MNDREYQLITHIQQTLTELDAESRLAASVCAVVEMGLLDEAQRRVLTDRYEGEPCLLQPAFNTLKPLGPWLFTAHSVTTLLVELYPLAERGFHGLLITHQPVADEAEKLGRFCVVTDAEGEEQLLRYYSPHVLPVIHSFKDAAWYAGLFGSLSHWWLPGLDGWQEYQGAWSPDAEITNVSDGIALTPALLQALGSDPLAHQMLGELEAASPSLFPVECPGIRLAMVEKALGEARHSGLEDLQDLSVYVAFCIAHGFVVIQQPDFQRAVALSLSTSRSLASTLKETDSQGFVRNAGEGAHG